MLGLVVNQTLRLHLGCRRFLPYYRGLQPQLRTSGLGRYFSVLLLDSPLNHRVQSLRRKRRWQLSTLFSRRCLPTAIAKIAALGAPQAHQCKLAVLAELKVVKMPALVGRHGIATPVVQVQFHLSWDWFTMLDHHHRDHGIVAALALKAR